MGVAASIVVAVGAGARADTTAIAMPAMAGPYNDLTIVCAPCTTSAKMKRPSAPAREVRIV
ncbi:MAG TPA: hypothetical protein VL463_31745, partial [Kofleriaceae bacterium]|nr:hypothetical protein [Kofleriaceae bacterium]